MNSTIRVRWLASSEVISQVLFTSKELEQNKMAFVAIFSQIKLLFGPLVIQLVWYILKQLFTSVSVKVVDINSTSPLRGSVNIHHYSPPLRWIIVNYYFLMHLSGQESYILESDWLIARAPVIRIFPSGPRVGTATNFPAFASFPTVFFSLQRT